MTTTRKQVNDLLFATRLKAYEKAGRKLDTVEAFEYLRDSVAAEVNALFTKFDIESMSPQTLLERKAIERTLKEMAEDAKGLEGEPAFERIMERIQFYKAGSKRVPPPGWENIFHDNLRTITKEAEENATLSKTKCDPEWTLYQRLRAKFKGKK